jgi:sugar phosphate permease
MVYFIAYLDRVNISVVAPMVMREFNISKVELGAVFAAFSLGYVLFQIPIGMLGDKFGPRKVLTGLVAFWSLMTAATGLAWNMTSLVTLRFLFGVGQAGAFPNATKAFSFWVPLTSRGKVQGLTQACARVGGAVTPWILAPAAAVWGWRPAFYLCASIGLAWVVIWFFWYRDRPAQYQAKWGGINQAEMDLIQAGRTPVGKAVSLPLRQLLSSRNMWAICASYFGYCYCFWIYLTWLPTYLIEARGFSFLSMGVFASLPLFVGGIGAALGGWATDWVMVKTGSGRTSRRAVAMTGMLLSALFMIPGALTESAYLSVFFLTGSLFWLELSVAAYWAVCLDIGHEYAGAVSGMMNSLGSASSIASPILFGAIVQFTNSWIYPFYFASGFVVVSALLWLWIDPELSITDEIKSK